MVDTPPVNSAVDIKGGSLSQSWWKWFVQLYDFVRNGVVDYTATSVQVPVNGFSIVMADKSQVLMLDPAGALATGTVFTPVNPYDGQKLEVSSTFAITAMTFSPSGTQTVKNAPTTLVAGVGFSYYYRASSTTWYRLS